MDTYTQAEEKLNGRAKRKLENNTYLERFDPMSQELPRSIGVKLHRTHVVIYYDNGDVQLNSGGWQTVTTKDRINNYAPCHLWQERGLWTVSYGDKLYRFADQMRLHADGTVTGAFELMEKEKAVTR